MFRVEMLPACHGDCLWVEYGEKGAVHRVLIDGGFGRAYPDLRARVLAIPEAERHFDLMVVTHVDADHIEGMVSLLADEKVAFSCGDFWFNGWDQISDGSFDFGAVQGEYLSALLQKRKLPWNRLFDGKAVVVPEDGPLPVRDLPGGLRLTLLSPTPKELLVLSMTWQEECKKAGLVPGEAAPALERLEKRDRRLVRSFAPGADPEVEEWARAPFVKDGSAANGSSIALLAEFGGRRVLLASDAFSGVLEQGIDRLNRERKQELLELDAFKLPHHGSDANLAPSLMTRLRARRILVSTNGDRFGHPDPECLARVVTSGRASELVFNYRSEDNEMWEEGEWQDRYRYRAKYPAGDATGATIDLESE